MIPVDRPRRLALAIVPALIGVALAAIPAARACDMKAVDDELAREAAAPAPQLHAAADPSPNNDPSPNDDTSAKPSGQTGSAPANGSDASGSQSAASQAGAKPTAPMGHTATEPENKK